RAGRSADDHLRNRGRLRARIVTVVKVEVENHPGDAAGPDRRVREPAGRARRGGGRRRGQSERDRSHACSDPRSSHSISHTLPTANNAQRRWRWNGKWSLARRRRPDRQLIADLDTARRGCSRPPPHLWSRTAPQLRPTVTAAGGGSFHPTRSYGASWRTLKICVDQAPGPAKRESCSGIAGLQRPSSGSTEVPDLPGAPDRNTDCS